MADISKITLPSGTTYEIKDAVARQAASAGLQLVVVETLPTASADTMGKIYLIPDTHGTDPNVKIEYVTVKGGTDASPTYTWEQIGTSATDLSGYAKKGTYTGTFSGSGTVASKTVSFTGTTTDEVYGTGTTFALASGTVAINETKKYVKASASGAAVGADGTASAITGFGTHSYVSAIPSVTPSTKKLATSSVTGVSGSTTASKVSITSKTASKATAGTAVAVAKTGSAVTVGDGTTTASTTNTDILKSVSVSNETLVIGACTLDTTSVTPAVSNGSITPYTFADVACSAVSASDVTVPTAASSATTVVTGLTTSGTGADVVTSVAVGTAANAISALGTPTTATVLTGVKVTSQPTVSLALQDASATGTVQVVTDVPDGSVGTTVNASTTDKVNAIVGLGTGTVSSQTVNVGGSTSTTI